MRVASLLRAFPFVLAWLALTLEIAIGAIWAVGVVGDPAVYDLKADIVRGASGLATVFISLFAALAFSQMRVRPRWTAMRLVSAVFALLLTASASDLLLGRVFAIPFLAALNLPVLLAAAVLAADATKRAHA